MAIEISAELYLFTCVRCAARWTESYQVSQAIDDAGDIRSFYRHDGVPCEAPVSGNVECPNCHDTRALRDPLYGTRPDFHPEEASHILAVPRPRADVGGGAEERPRPTRHPAGGTWHRFKFSAVVTLEAAGRSRREYPSGVPGLMVRAPSCQRPNERQYFPAVVYTDDDRPLRPGDKGVLVIISVPNDDASECFQTGQQFTLWDGTDIGHGTVGQRLFFR